MGLALEYWIELAILTSGLVAMNLIFIAGAFRATGTVTPTGAGLLGDFVGGYIGTFFSLVGVVLLFLTLRVQRRSSQIVNFETKYFELLRLHRDNVEELEVQGVSGRKLFVVLIREFRSALEVVRRVADTRNEGLNQRQFIRITHYVLLFGTGPNSTRMLTQSLTDFQDAFIHALVKEFEKPEVKEKAQADRKLGYVPFEGHQSRLGHYFRHLYQAVCYVDKQSIDIDKCEYVKTIRAQLSTHEQALLLLNSLTPIGASWWKQKFIERYRLVRNLPREFFDPETELDTNELFPKGYFEWEEASGVAYSHAQTP